MSTEGLTPLELERFGGLYTAQGDQTKVPQGRSPSCQDVKFYQGGAVGTREAYTTKTTFSGLDVLGIKEYVDLTQTRRLITLLSDGSLRYETGTFSFSSFATNVVASGVAPFLRLSSTTLFGKEWICFGASSLFGSNPAKVFYQDGASGNFFFDPVAPEGPATAPTVVTAATPGSVSVGTHQFRIFYKTRSGYWTQLGPATSLNVTTALRQVTVSGIPIGPAYIAGRVVAATPATSNNFFFIPGSAMEINDNTTTSVTFDFSDAALTNATAVTHPTDVTQDLFRQINLNAPGAVAHYSGRAVYWGWRHTYVRNGDTGPYNMRFQCGYTGNVPNGWTEKVAGETKATSITGSVYGEPVRITGNGTNQVGCLENTSQVNLFIPPTVDVWVRIRAKKSSTATSGNLYLYICTSGTAATSVNGTSSGSSQNVAVLPFSSISSTEWGVFSLRMFASGANTFNNTHRFRISAGNTVAGTSLPNGATCDIDYIEIYTPGYDGDNNISLLRFSKVNNPEAFDGLYSPMLVENENGEAVTACFEQRGSFFICKERSMFVTTDNGTTEPSDWGVEKVSPTVGTPSRDGVGLGPGFAIIASRSGAFFFDGRDPIKISTEIDPTWQRINFTNGAPGPAQKIWCRVDPDIKRIYIGVPLDGATDVSHILVCDYQAYETGNDQSGTPANPDARDWTIWTAHGNKMLCSGFSIRPDGSRATLIGDDAGRILLVDSSSVSDYGTTAIAATYRTNFFRPAPVRFLLGYLVLDINGAGSLTLKTIGPDTSTAKTWNSPSNTLASAPNKNAEWGIRHIGEHIAVELSTSAIGAHWFLGHMVAWMRSPAPSGGTRGHAV